MGVKISELEEKTTANDTDVIPIVDDGTKKITKANLLKEINDKINGTELYSNEVGTNGAISFNGQLEAGNLIEIIYCRRRVVGTSIYKTTGKIPYLSGIEVALDINYYSSANNLQSIAKLVVVSDSGITVSGENTFSNGNITETGAIYITKVIKYE